MEFRVYDWIDDLEDELSHEIKEGTILNEDDVQEYIRQAIDNACIYYEDCMDIIEELGAYDFSKFELECTTISQVAYCALFERVQEHDLSYDYLKNSIDD